MMTLKSCLCLLWIMSGMASGETECEPAEEGSSYIMSCNSTDRYDEVYWYKKDDFTGYKSYVGVCFIPYHCYPLYQDSFLLEIDVYGTTTLNIINVSRTGHHNSEGTWLCGDDLYDFMACNHLEVYAKAENPLCEEPMMSDSQTHIFVTCRTDNVYPQAGCQFLGRRDTNKIVYIPLEGKITYNHIAKNETPVYYKSECTLELDVSSLKDGNIFLKVNMYPNVTDGARFGVESNIIIFNPVSFGSSDNSGSDDTVTICLIVAVVMIALVAVVLGVLMIFYRKRYNTLASTRKTTNENPGYETVDVSQADTVTSYNTATHDNEAFGMATSGDVKLQVGTQTKARENVYENMRGEPRHEKESEEDIYEN